MVAAARVFVADGVMFTRAPAAHLVACPVYEAVTECCQAVGAAVEEAVPLSGCVCPHNVLPAGRTHRHEGGVGGRPRPQPAQCQQLTGGDSLAEELELVWLAGVEVLHTHGWVPGLVAGARWLQTAVVATARNRQVRLVCERRRGDTRVVSCAPAVESDLQPRLAAHTCTAAGWSCTRPSQ